jgi:tetratricopeptide (TPR) repeat protein
MGCCKKWLTITVVFGICVGCTVSLRGPQYLASEDYSRGIKDFEARLSSDPNDPEINYYLGRFYLAREEPEKALEHLKIASARDPKNADIHYWLGVAQWAVMDFDAEYRSYRQALEIDAGHIPARLYMGHNLLDRGRWPEALEAYDGVLKIDAFNPEALYNRALAIKKIGSIEQQAAAWKRYLNLYPEGQWAIRAADHLNALGDFTFRNHSIGLRKVTLAAISFKEGSTELTSEAKNSLRVVGSILSNNRDIELQVTCFVKGDEKLAVNRSRSVVDFIAMEFPNVDPSRIIASGRGEADIIRLDNITVVQNRSVVFTNRDQ